MSTSASSNDLSPLGQLAQMCLNYYKEFDLVIRHGQSMIAKSSTKQASRLMSVRSIEEDSGPRKLKREDKKALKRLKRLMKKKKKNRVKHVAEQSDSQADPSQASSSNLSSASVQFGILANSELTDENQPSRDVMETPAGSFKFSSSSSQTNNCCSWIVNDRVCGFQARSSEELGEHIRFHFTSILFSSMDYYHKLKALNQ